MLLFFETIKDVAPFYLLCVLTVAIGIAGRSDFSRKRYNAFFAPHEVINDEIQEIEIKSRPKTPANQLIAFLWSAILTLLLAFVVLTVLTYVAFTITCYFIR